MCCACSKSIGFRLSRIRGVGRATTFRCRGQGGGARPGGYLLGASGSQTQEGERRHRLAEASRCCYAPPARMVCRYSIQADRSASYSTLNTTSRFDGCLCLAVPRKRRQQPATRASWFISTQLRELLEQLRPKITGAFDKIRH